MNWDQSGEGLEYGYVLSPDYDGLSLMRRSYYYDGWFYLHCKLAPVLSSRSPEVPFVPYTGNVESIDGSFY